MKRIYIVRHGETDLNTQKDNSDRIMTQPKNTELSQNGKEQAIKTGKYFKKNRNPIDIIICSNTIRAKQTAELIADEIGYKKQEIIYEDKLKEIQLNPKYEDLTRKEFKSLRNNDSNVKAFFEFHEKKAQIKCPIELNEFIIKNESAPNNDVYEKAEDISNRVNDVIETLKILPKENILIISHGGTIRWLNKILSNNIGSDEFKGYMVNNKSNCAITHYVCQNNTFYLISAHSNKHLKYT